MRKLGPWFFAELFTTAIAVVALSGQAVQAQYSGIDLRERGLTKEDYAILSAAGEELYATGEPVVGSETGWSNPETGASGNIKLTDYDGRCVRLDYVINAPTKKNPSRLDWRLCRQDDGRWLNAPE